MVRKDEESDTEAAVRTLLISKLDLNGGALNSVEPTTLALSRIRTPALGERRVTCLNAPRGAFNH